MWYNHPYWIAITIIWYRFFKNKKVSPDKDKSEVESAGTVEVVTQPPPVPKLRIDQNFLTSSRNRPAIRKDGGDFYQLRKVKAIVVHWTANTNKGADAAANRNYFNTTMRYASCHYIADDVGVIYCVPEDEVAYHVGSNRGYTDFGNALIEDNRLTPNFYTIGIEMCVNEDGDWIKTKRNTIRLLRQLRKNMAPIPIVRHYDITKKKCPQFPDGMGGFQLLEGKGWERFKISV